MIGRMAGAGIVALALGVSSFSPALARTPYDGAWALTIHTQRGVCDSTYHFDVQIRNGIVSHANIVRFRGRVGKNGAVSVSVAVERRSAHGTGRLSGSQGRGRWAGRSGSDRCSGYWTARRA